MCFGSETERTFEGECRTTADVAKLFDRYRIRARRFAEEAGRDDAPADQGRQTEPAEEPVLAGR